MFVGCVVAGAVVLVSGGAKMRGALLRDVAGYLVAVAAAAGVLASGRATGGRAAALLALYAAFVLVVLGADLWRIIRERMRCGTRACFGDQDLWQPCVHIYDIYTHTPMGKFGDAAAVLGRPLTVRCFDAALGRLARYDCPLLSANNVQDWCCAL